MHECNGKERGGKEKVEMQDGGVELWEKREGEVESVFEEL